MAASDHFDQFYVGVYITFANGTARQRGLVLEALRQCRFPFDRLAFQVRVRFTDNPDPSIHYEAATTYTTVYPRPMPLRDDNEIDGMSANGYMYPADVDVRAEVRILNGLSDPNSRHYESDEFFKDVVIHEFGHILAGCFTESLRLDMCAALDIPEQAWRANTSDREAWGGNGEELFCETFKDVFMPKEHRAYDNRTGFPVIPEENLPDFFDVLEQLIGYTRRNDHYVYIIGSPWQYDYIPDGTNNPPRWTVDPPRARHDAGMRGRMIVGGEIWFTGHWGHMGTTDNPVGSLRDYWETSWYITKGGPHGPVLSSGSYDSSREVTGPRNTMEFSPAIPVWPYDQPPTDQSYTAEDDSDLLHWHRFTGGGVNDVCVRMGTDSEGRPACDLYWTDIWDNGGHGVTYRVRNEAPRMPRPPYPYIPENALVSAGRPSTVRRSRP